MGSISVEQPYADSTHRPISQEFPDLGDSISRFLALEGHEKVKSCIRDVFKRHGVESPFSSALMYLEFAEQFVELLNGSITRAGKPGPFEAPDGQFLSRSWRVEGHDLEPYEFLKAPQKDCGAYPQPALTAEFVQDPAQVLDQTGLSDVLGVTDAEHATEKRVTFGQDVYISQPLGGATIQSDRNAGAYSTREEECNISPVPSLSETDSGEELSGPENDFDMQDDGIRFVDGRFTGPGVWTASADTLRPSKEMELPVLNFGHGLWQGMCTL
ncbi:hypothetical protein BJ170DRAFT_603178 [Xylariales sp. AK1849]|nr:hypothetical protein BJ170DRAFT_603178 [Xylariales sp. AK1849]